MPVQTPINQNPEVSTQRYQLIPIKIIYDNRSNRVTFFIHIYNSIPMLNLRNLWTSF